MDASIKQLARERMKGHCRVCPQCDGKVCAGEVPGMGGLGTGSSFRANIEALARVKLAMRCLHTAAQPDTSTEILGLKLALPLLAARRAPLPCARVRSAARPHRHHRRGAGAGL